MPPYRARRIFPFWNLNRGRSACTVLFAIVIGGTSAVAAEAPVTASERLGIRYDAQARERARTQARSQSGSFLANEPLDPDIVRLPNYTVTEEPIHLEERDVLTPKGEVEMAKKRYLTPMYRKTFGPLSAIATLLNNPLGGWQPNGPEAMALYEDFEGARRKKRFAELNELAELADDAKKPRGKRKEQRAK
jgi:hypothetical protein